MNTGNPLNLSWKMHGNCCPRNFNQNTSHEHVTHVQVQYKHKRFKIAATILLQWSIDGLKNANQYKVCDLFNAGI